jgi:hypothetical protein
MYNVGLEIYGFTASNSLLTFSVVETGPKDKKKEIKNFVHNTINIVQTTRI